jgi:eukaryotic-like serine/threonine-protein kinase
MGVPGRIGRYLILGELGQGAMGTVYRGRDETLDRDVAVKVMSKGLADPDARARFLREARAAARLQHPNIVVIYELGEHEGAPFMALELLEGVDLQRGIDSGIRPDPRATLPVVLQLLAGLGHAHEHGIVHRDVKPSNVFLPFGRPAKIMDFGVARLAGAGTTSTGVVVGTANYMSPEQASAGEIDGRSDLFSAGLILYELVTGEKAYKADSIVAMIYKITHEPPDLSLIPEGPEWQRLRGVLTRALARKPEDRYPDARAMSAELAQALVDLGGTVDGAAPSDQALLVRPRAAVRAAPAPGPLPTATLPSPTPAPPTVGPVAVPPRRSGVIAVVGAVALLAIAATAAWLWLRPGAVPTPAPSAVPSPTPTAASTAAVARAPTATPGTARLAPTPAAGLAATPTPSPAAPAPAATPTPAAIPTPAAAPAPVPGLGPEARLARAEDLVARGRWPEALAEARAVLEVQPRNARATALAQQAEAEIVIGECLRNARAALQEGDRERALEELRRGFLVRGNDPRLLALHREVVQQ